MEIKYIVKNSTQQPVITMGYSLLNMAAGNGIAAANPPKSLNELLPTTEGPKVIHVQQHNRNKNNASAEQRDFYMDTDDTLMSLRDRMQLLATASKAGGTKEIPITQTTH